MSRPPKAGQGEAIKESDKLPRPVEAALSECGGPVPAAHARSSAPGAV